MPTAPISPSTRIHSWSLVYRIFSGTMLFLFRSFVKRGFHRHRIHGLVADHDLHIRARPGMGSGQVTQPDVPPKSRRRRATGDPSGGRPIEIHFVAIATDAAAAHLEAG